MLTHLLFLILQCITLWSIEQSLRLGDKGGREYASLFSSSGFTYQQERLALIPGGDQCTFTPGISRQLPLLGLCDVTSKVLHPPFTNSVQRTTKNPCSLDDFLVTKSSIKWRITTSWGGGLSCPVGLVESEWPVAFWLRGLPLSWKAKVNLLF